MTGATAKKRKPTVEEAERLVLKAAKALEEGDIWFLANEEGFDDLADALFALRGAEERAGTR